MGRLNPQLDARERREWAHQAGVSAPLRRGRFASLSPRLHQPVANARSPTWVRNSAGSWRTSSALRLALSDSRPAPVLP